MGAADARDRGIDAASGEFVTFMDCDDVTMPERLHKQVEFLKSSAEIGAVGTRAQMVNLHLTELLFFKNPPELHALIAFTWFF